MYHPETPIEIATLRQQEIKRKYIMPSIRHERGHYEAQRILLERQGTRWEGSGKKTLPTWMKQKEDEVEDQLPNRYNLLGYVKHLAIIALRIIRHPKAKKLQLEQTK